MIIIRALREVTRLFGCLDVSLEHKEGFISHIRQNRPREDQEYLNQFELNVMVLPKVDSNQRDLQEQFSQLQLPRVISAFQREYESFYREHYAIVKKDRLKMYHKVGCVFLMAIPNSPWGSIETTTIGKTHPTLPYDSCHVTRRTRFESDKGG